MSEDEVSSSLANTWTAQQVISSVSLALVLVGCFGNLVSFIIFSRPHMRTSSVNILLCALSFIDFFLIVMAVPVFLVSELNVIPEGFEDSFTSFVVNWLYPFELIMQTCSVYMIITITLERWTAVCRPFQARILCTPRKSKIAIAIVFLFSFSYNLIRFFEYSTAFDPLTNRSFTNRLRTPNRWWYYVGYYTLLYVLTHFVLPFTLLALMNGNVILAMWRGRRMRQLLTRQVLYSCALLLLTFVAYPNIISFPQYYQQREQSTTVMLLIVTFVFAFCNVLPFLLNVAEGVYPTLFNDHATMEIAYSALSLSNLLVILNSATTFIVYFLFSEKYRHTLFFLLKNGLCVSRTDYNTYRAMSRTASMRMSSTNEVPRPASKMSTDSRGSEALLKPLYLQRGATDRAGSRNDRLTTMWDGTKLSAIQRARPTSEYNERTAKSSPHLIANVEEQQLPRLPHEKRKRKHKTSVVDAQNGAPAITITLSEDSQGDMRKASIQSNQS